YERRERLRDGSGAAAEVSDRPALIEQAEQCDIVASPEQLQAHAVPLACRRREKLLRFGAALRQNCLRPPRVVLGGVGVHHLIADDVPQAATCRIQRSGCQPVIAAGPLGSRVDPAFAAQHLEVSTDGRLGQLQDGRQLVDREFVALDGYQKPAPRRIGEGRHLSKKGWRAHLFHPSIRIEGYIARLGKSRRYPAVCPLELRTPIFLVSLLPLPLPLAPRSQR